MAHQIIAHSVSEEEIKEQESIVSSFMTSTNKLSTSIRVKLEGIDKETDRLAPTAPPGSGDLRMRKVKHAALLKKFTSLMKRLQEIERHASSKHQAQVQRQYRISMNQFACHD